MAIHVYGDGFVLVFCMFAFSPQNAMLDTTTSRTGWRSSDAEEPTLCCHGRVWSASISGQCRFWEYISAKLSADGNEKAQRSSDLQLPVADLAPADGVFLLGSFRLPADFADSATPDPTEVEKASRKLTLFRQR